MRTLDFDNRWWSVNVWLKNFHFFIFLYFLVFVLAVSRDILGKFGLTLFMGLILRQQMELIVAYIWKIDDVIKSLMEK